MTDTRFRWDAASELEAAFELKSRAIVKPAAARQDGLRCRIKACRHHIKIGEQIYLPTANPGKDNRTAAHVDCVDRFCAEQTAKGAAQERANQERELQAKRVLPLLQPTTAIAKGTSAGVSRPQITEATMLSKVEEIARKIYEKGYQAGLAAALAALEEGRDDFEAAH